MKVGLQTMILTLTIIDANIIKTAKKQKKKMAKIKLYLDKRQVRPDGSFPRRQYRKRWDTR